MSSTAVELIRVPSDPAQWPARVTKLPKWDYVTPDGKWQVSVTCSAAVGPTGGSLRTKAVGS